MLKNKTIHSPIPWKAPTFEPRALTYDTLHIWQTVLSATPEFLNQCHQVLSQDEIVRGKQFKFPEHQQRFIITRGTLRHILARYLSCPPEQIQFDYHTHGKPVLSDPHKGNLYFNLSHSKNLALYLIGCHPTLGIDVEWIENSVNPLAISKRFFSKIEQKALLQLPESMQLQTFFRIWTQKEAFIKALGQGLSFPLEDFAVSALPDHPGLIYLKNETDLSDWSFFSFEPLTKYTAAVAVKAKINHIDFFK